MLGQRRRRCLSIEPTLGGRFYFRYSVSPAGYEAALNQNMANISRLP